MGTAIKGLIESGQNKKKKERVKKKAGRQKVIDDERDRLSDVRGRSLLGEAGLGGSLLSGRPGGVGGGTILG